MIRKEKMTQEEKDNRQINFIIMKLMWKAIKTHYESNDKRYDFYFNMDLRKDVYKRIINGENFRVTPKLLKYIAEAGVDKKIINGKLKFQLGKVCNDKLIKLISYKKIISETKVVGANVYTDKDGKEVPLQSLEDKANELLENLEGAIKKIKADKKISDENLYKLAYFWSDGRAADNSIIALRNQIEQINIITLKDLDELEKEYSGSMTVYIKYLETQLNYAKAVEVYKKK